MKHVFGGPPWKLSRAPSGLERPWMMSTPRAAGPEDRGRLPDVATAKPGEHLSCPWDGPGGVGEFPGQVIAETRVRQSRKFIPRRSRRKQSARGLPRV